MLEVGPYQLLSPIAAGGFGQVYLARRNGLPGFSRFFAMKCLHERHAEDGAALAMLIDEARLASRINHANVLSVIDVVDHGGALWLVMDYVEGESFARLIAACNARGEGAPRPFAAAIVAGALHGLHAAHEARGPDGRHLGLVHRDVSPHNILVTTHGTAKLHDFGIAKASGRIALTEPGQVKGRLAYMAPEQLSGDAVDRRADLYAMGVVLWEALMGRRPFDSSAPTLAAERKEGALLAAELAVPAVLRAVVAKALALRPEERFATASEMATALEDATPIAKDREVADWVAATAADSLRVRRAVVESASAMPATSGPSSDETQSAIEIAAPPAHAAPVLAPAPAVARPRTGAPSGAVLYAFAGLIGVVGAVLLVLSKGSSEPNQSVDPPVPDARLASASSRAIPTPIPILTPSPPPSPSLSPSPSPSPSLPPSSSPALAPGRIPSPTASPARPASCDPPYELDARGVKVIKLDCVR